MHLPYLIFKYYLPTIYLKGVLVLFDSVSCSEKISFVSPDAARLPGVECGEKMPKCKLDVLHYYYYCCCWLLENLA